MPTLVIGQPFDPRPAVCGFHPMAIVDRSRLLNDAQKRIYGLLYAFATSKGTAYGSAETIGERLGMPPRTVEYHLAGLKDLGLLRSERHGQAPASWLFLYHEMFLPENDPTSKPQSIAVQEPRLNRKLTCSKPQDSRPKPQPIADKLESKRSQSGKRRLQESSSSVQRKQGLEVSVFEKDAGGTFTPPGSSEPEKAKPLSLRVDDDEKTWPEPTPDPGRMLNEAEYRAATAPKPELARTLKAPDEFKARLQERHAACIAAGTLDPEQVLADVKADLGNTPLSAFLEADAKATTNPAALRNPAGHYRTLARKTARREASAPLEMTLRSVASLQDQMEAAGRKFEADERARMLAKYACCTGTGKTPDGAYCGCGCGDLLRQIDERTRLEPFGAGCDGSCTDGLTLDGEPCTCAEGQKARRNMEATA